VNYDEWENYYQRKTGEGINKQPDDEGVWSEKYGFFYWSKDNSRLLIKAVCGDHEYWLLFANKLAFKLGLNELWMYSKRSRRAWERKGWHWVKQVQQGNIFKRYVGR
jgi:hypothetical protein